MPQWRSTTAKYFQRDFMNVIYHNDEVQIVDFCCILRRIIVDISIELMRAETQVWARDVNSQARDETEKSAFETETRPRRLNIAPRRDRDKTMDRSRDGLGLGHIPAESPEYCLVIPNYIPGLGTQSVTL
jgi:hypothetical protein